MASGVAISNLSSLAIRVRLLANILCAGIDTPRDTLYCIIIAQTNHELCLARSRPMALTIEEVKHVAHLARLRLSEEELNKLQIDLSHILDHIDMLKEVDVSDV